MKLLIDENISWRIKKKISITFPECIHVSDIRSEIMKDREIWGYALSNNYTIVTLDEDFFEIQTIKGFPPKIIWLRIGNSSTDNIAMKIFEYKKVIEDFILNNEIGLLEIY